MQVKERGVKISQEQRYDSVPGQDSSHARYSDERVPGKSIEVTLRNAEEFLNYLSGVEPGHGSPTVNVSKLTVSAEAAAVAICMLTKNITNAFIGTSLHCLVSSGDSRLKEDMYEIHHPWLHVDSDAWCGVGIGSTDAFRLVEQTFVSSVTVVSFVQMVLRGLPAKTRFRAMLCVVF
jgi:hypothetical protein